MRTIKPGANSDPDVAPVRRFLKPASRRTSLPPSLHPTAARRHILRHSRDDLLFPRPGSGTPELHFLFILRPLADARPPRRFSLRPSLQSHLLLEYLH